ALRAVGLDSSDFVGHSVVDVFQHHPLIPSAFRECLAGREVSGTLEIGTGVLEMWSGPDRDESGRIHGIVGVATDITEKQQLQARAIEADRVSAIGTLAASIAHEINNPLTYLSGAVDRMS